MNPADLHLPGLDATPPLSSKTLPGSASLLGKTVKLPATVPRIDTEPIYTALKAAVGDNWGDYKAALSAFLLGKLNQTELTRTLAPILTFTAPAAPLGGTPVPSSIHLHNTLLSSLYANALYRDAPPETTAAWVLATDAPSSSSNKPSHAGGANDKIDDRNRREVMALSIRDRRRIKSVKDPDASAQMDQGMYQARRYHEALDALPSSVLYGLGVSGPGGAASSLSKTNTDLEIRRRFALPLAAETEEFPSHENIAARIEPICYEEGLTSAIQASSLSTCAELVETALETYVQELVGGWLRSVRSDADGLVQRRRHKRRLRAEERAEDRGEIARDPLGRLPVEIESCAKRPPIGPQDLRLAARFDERLRTMPFLRTGLTEEPLSSVFAAEIAAASAAATAAAAAENVLPDPNASIIPGEKDTPKTPKIIKTNGLGLVNGFGGHDHMDIDDGPAIGNEGVDLTDDDNEEEEDDLLGNNGWGWQGAARGERTMLMDVLGGALAVG